MSYDHGLVERLRDAIARVGERGVRDKNVFGGRGFLTGRSAFVIAADEGLIVKITPDEHDAVLAMRGVTPFAPMGERPMSTWVVADDDATADDDDLTEWVRRGLRGVRAAPAKKSRAAAPRKATKARTGPAKPPAAKKGAKKTPARKK
jgi:TfoX/Sxy family transcriptional regulator of competence genes